jgi:hypothetical protein
MSDYRAYLFGLEGHRFVRVDEFLSDYPSDAAAIDAARRLAGMREIEIWNGPKFIARISSEKEATSPPLSPPLMAEVTGSLNESEEAVFGDSWPVR